MNGTSDSQSSLKDRLVVETKRFLMIFTYLLLSLGVMVNYKRAILADYGIPFFEFGYAAIEAFILAKVILIGHVWRLEKKRYMGKPLIYTTLYSALIFSLLVVGFNVIEQVIAGWIHHRTVVETVYEVIEKGWHEMLARCLFLFVIFIPYFAFLEIGAMLGEGKLFEVFFLRHAASTGYSTGDSTNRA